MDRAERNVFFVNRPTATAAQFLSSKPDDLREVLFPEMLRGLPIAMLQFGDPVRNRFLL